MICFFVFWFGWLHSSGTVWKWYSTRNSLWKPKLRPYFSDETVCFSFLNTPTPPTLFSFPFPSYLDSKVSSSSSCSFFNLIIYLNLYVCVCECVFIPECCKRSAFRHCLISFVLCQWVLNDNLQKRTPWTHYLFIFIPLSLLQSFGSLLSSI